MKKPLFIFVTVFILITNLLAVSALDQEEARAELKKLNLIFNEPTFFLQCMVGNASTIQLFLDAGMSTETRNALGATPLLTAASMNKNDIASVLLAADADVNAKDFQDNTAIYYAVTLNNKSLVEELAKHGADPEIKNNFDFSAMKMAKNLDRKDLISLMARTKLKSNRGELIIPPDYPTIKSETSLKILSDKVLEEAKTDIKKVDSFQREENKYGYLLGTKEYSDFAGKVLFGVAAGKTNLDFVLITPYSAVRYEYWRAAKQFKPVDKDLIDSYIARKNSVCIIVAPADAFTTNFLENRFGYTGMKHEAAITNVVIRKGSTVYQNIQHDGNKWYFPIDLFVGTEGIEVIAVDSDNEQKILKVDTKRIAPIK